MWTDFWNLIAAPFKALFEIMPVIGGHVNILLIAIASIACVIWIRIMLKDKVEEKF
jgi:hypothetical protein